MAGKFILFVAVAVTALVVMTQAQKAIPFEARIWPQANFKGQPKTVTLTDSKNCQFGTGKGPARSINFAKCVKIWSESACMGPVATVGAPGCPADDLSKCTLVNPKTGQKVSALNNVVTIRACSP